jgi:peroxiredoxin
LHEKYQSTGLRILAVNAWDESKTLVSEFVKENELPYTVLLEGEEVFKKTYRGETVPTTYLLDRSGRIVYVHHGWGPGDEKLLSRKIEEALRS